MSAVLVAAAVLAGGAAPASSSAPSSRSSTETYSTPHGIWIEGHGDEDHGNLGALPLVAPVTFKPEAGERLLEVAVQDLTERPVMVHVTQAGNGHHDHGVSVTFCSKKHPAIRLTSGAPVEVSVYSGFCLNHTYGVATSGTITATFSRR
ncbi:MAG: hypothetical protein M3N53_14105 [Actinomycetota bacterium]|nr:hypothetical protein [Actinomycetota bacterium]